MASEAVKDLVFGKGNGFCIYCGTTITRSAHGSISSALGIKTSWEIEHWQPVTRSSSESEANRCQWSGIESHLVVG